MKLLEILLLLYIYYYISTFCIPIMLVRSFEKFRYVTITCIIFQILTVRPRIYHSSVAHSPHRILDDEITPENRVAGQSCIRVSIALFKVRGTVYRLRFRTDIEFEKSVRITRGGRVYANGGFLRDSTSA